MVDIQLVVFLVFLWVLLQVWKTILLILWFLLSVRLWWMVPEWLVSLLLPPWRRLQPLARRLSLPQHRRSRRHPIRQRSAAANAASGGSRSRSARTPSCLPAALLPRGRPGAPHATRPRRTRMSLSLQQGEAHPPSCRPRRPASFGPLALQQRSQEAARSRGTPRA